jgi:hypothetical protein
MRRLSYGTMAACVVVFLVLATFTATVTTLPRLLRVLGISPDGTGALADWFSGTSTLIALAAAASGVVWQVRTDLAHRRRVEADQDFIAALRVIAWVHWARQGPVLAAGFSSPRLETLGASP